MSRAYFSVQNDGGASTRCYNLDCSPGFVQTNNKVALGSYLTPPSTPGGTQTFVPVTIHIDNVEEKWWVSFALEEIGYIPAFNFPMFYEGLANVFGGLVAFTSSEFTSTQMGSGYLPSAGIGYTGLIGNYFAINSNGVRAQDPPLGKIVTQPSCYDYGDIGYLPAPGAGYYIAYGGPGGEYCDGTSP
ncbi:hypothetical protein ACMD2_04084 [Ananas comosus]|uniref:Neprosin PEP catalytic domain-containing protein n=1 Tax=Ananas comosus TaxID=4615 RepID=A0A199W8F0_ANACO|nr:hypothetical protein ACMD2_04084 [Ananas comosus]